MPFLPDLLLHIKVTVTYNESEQQQMLGRCHVNKLKTLQRQHELHGQEL